MNADQFILCCDALVIWCNWHLFRVMRRWGKEPPEPTWVYFNAVQPEEEEKVCTCLNGLSRTQSTLESWG